MRKTTHSTMAMLQTMPMPTFAVSTSATIPSLPSGSEKPCRAAYTSSKTGVSSLALTAVRVTKIQSLSPKTGRE